MSKKITDQYKRNSDPKVVDPIEQNTTFTWPTAKVESSVVNTEFVLADEKDITIANQKSLIEELSAQLEMMALKPVSNNPVVTVDGKNYEVVIPIFHYKGKVTNAQELLADQELINELVAIGSGVLIPIE